MRQRKDLQVKRVKKVVDSPLPHEIKQKFPTIAGFWRRFFSFFIDIILLGLFGLLVGVIFFKPLANLGPYGRPVGLLFIVPYFGIMNSKIAGGQSFGKMICNIAVRNKDNEPIGVGRSILRILIIAIPFIINGLSIHFAENIIFSTISNILIIGIGGAFLYTMLFNRGARQGLHDLILGTYVISLSKKSLGSFPQTKKIHYIISGSWIATVTIFYIILSIFSPNVNSPIQTDKQEQLKQILAQNSGAFTSDIRLRTEFESDVNTTQILIVTLWIKSGLSEDDKLTLCNETARKIFDNIVEINNYDYLSISLNNGYDIGIAIWMKTDSCSNTIQGWKGSFE